MYHYVYLTTNVVNFKKYIGDHSSEILEDNYLGSGEYLKKAFKKYGRKNFKREILEIFPSKEEAFNSQEKYIQKFNTIIPFGYNISPKGGYGVPDSYLHEETRKKIGRSLLGENHPNFGKPAWNRGKKASEETKKKQSDSHKGQISWLKGTKGLIHPSEETKEKQRKALLGRPNPHRSHPCSEETKEKLRKPRGPMSEESKQKMRKPKTKRVKI